ncbi:MAG: AI-2E family transporter [Candidatus Zixiibacteriota bacterium]
MQNVNRDHLINVMFLVLAIGAAYMFYLLMAPFFTPIAYASILVIVFYPLYQRLLRFLRNPSLTSVAMCLVVTIVIVAPMVYLLATLAGEAKAALDYLTILYQSGELGEWEIEKLPGVAMIKEQLSRFTDPENLKLESIVVSGVSFVAGLLKDQLTTIIANTGRTVFTFGMMLFSMFFLFRDGHLFVRKISALIPLGSELVKQTIDDLKNVVEATIFGGVVVALLQGSVGGILFALVGLPSPVFWGAMMAFLSFLPLVGAFLVFVPASLILIFSGHLVKGIIVLAGGIVVISQIDNVVRPWLIAGRTSMHTLLLFFSILGGIALFGLLGIVLGPVVAALMLTLLKILEACLQGESKQSTPSPAQPT